MRQRSFKIPSETVEIWKIRLPALLLPFLWRCFSKYYSTRTKQWDFILLVGESIIRTYSLKIKFKCFVLVPECLTILILVFSISSERKKKEHKNKLHAKPQHKAINEQMFFLQRMCTVRFKTLNSIKKGTTSRWLNKIY